MKRRVALLLALPCALSAAPFDYQLKPVEVAPEVHVFEGRLEHFSRDNGGNIVNTGYIETRAGAVVIDTGPSRRYGEQMRARIEAATGKPPARVLLTHAHPDHFLGNQAFARDSLSALAATNSAISTIGEDLSANLYRMVGGWMEGTEAVVPAHTVEAGAIEVGGRRLRLLALAGHTAGDLAVYDETSRTLFAGDLVFFERAATTPNANLDTWLDALEQLATLDFAVLVPGHGPVVRDARAIEQTRAYLEWLRQALTRAASQGLDMNEAMQVEVPAQFRALAVFKPEFQRSIVHLYPHFEQDTFHAPATKP